MKKVIKMLLTVVMSLTIVATFPVSVFAYEYGEPNLNDMIQVKKVGEKEITSISADDVNRIRVSKSRKYRDKTDDERVEDIFVALGVDLNEAQKEEIDSNVSLSHIGGIQTSTVYLEIDEEGNQKEISEVVALSTTQVVEGATEIKNDSTITREPEPETDGKMKQQLTIIYTPHYSGTGTTPDRYVFFGLCEWIDEPVTRRTDCISLLSPDFRWSDYDENYSLFASYHRLTMEDGVCTMDEEVLEEIDGSEADVSSYAGVFFEYNLQDALWSPSTYVKYTDFSFMIMAVGYVSMDVSAVNRIGIDLVYTHSKTSIALNINFSWSGTGKTASISVSPTTTTKKYTLADQWSYQRHHNEFFS